MICRRLAATLVCGVVLTACRPSSTAASKALADADRAFNRATAERRADGWSEFFAEDGAMIRSTGTVTGKAAIHDVMAKTFADTSFTLTWDPDHGDVSGDVGYTDGRFEVRFRDDKGNPVSRTGRYLTVWKKQADGTWKVVRDIGVQDVRPQP
ncbi:MAG TPA: nuclear transport factor 2 family protein [Gemmatimonadales bacterium]|nr:nuclear transport factor 2 family protein [Gemmatimonadales bacterium]